MSFPVHGAASTEMAAEPATSFKTVFAGWFVATGIAAFLHAGEIASAFSNFDAWNPASSAKAMGNESTLRSMPP